MSLDKNTGAKRAREARADLGYTREGPLPDLVEAIEEHGGAHVVVLELPEGVAGAYAARADCPLLFVNGRQALTRQRFTLAHEFGHHRMGHASVVDEQQAISGQLHDPNEVRANAFAAEFLMPRDSVTAWGRENIRGSVSLEHVLLLACDYGVSAQAARYALQNAEVLTDVRRTKQLDDEIAAEMHVELGQRLGLEAPRDELADAAGRLPRIPAALRKSALGDPWPDRSTWRLSRCGWDASMRRSRRCRPGSASISSGRPPRANDRSALARAASVTRRRYVRPRRAPLASGLPIST